jgi:hypothetical protein
LESDQACKVLCMSLYSADLLNDEIADINFGEQNLSTKNPVTAATGFFVHKFILIYLFFHWAQRQHCFAIYFVEYLRHSGVYG